MNKVYWGDKPNNFGDVLTANLLDYFNIKYKHTNVTDEGNMYVIGSIARFASAGSTVLGSGIIRKTEILNPSADWRFVRGPLTRNKVIKEGGTCPKLYGDPALLLPKFCEESEKEYDVGIIPHYSHYRNFKKKYPRHNIINLVNPDPLEVAKEITKCRKIISTSLHGIICAHAYGIPAARILGHKKLFGDGSKFEDYYASVNLEPKISTINNPIYTDANLMNLNNLTEIFGEYS